MGNDLADTDGAKPAIEPEWWFMAIDDTQYWVKEIQDQVEKVLTVVLFDRRRHVHCCELAASYECWPVENLPIFKATTPDEQRDRIREQVAQFTDEQITYRHVHQLEARMRQAGVWPSETTTKSSCISGALFGPVAGLEFAYYGQSGVPLADTNDDLEKAWDDKREAVLEWYCQREVF